MKFEVEVKIEPSKSGKTFAVALERNGTVIHSVKGCKLANGQSGQFVSGPSSKMDDGTWFNYLYLSKEFSAYVTKLAIEAVGEAAPKPAPKAKLDDNYDESVPF